MASCLLYSYIMNLKCLRLRAQARCVVTFLISNEHAERQLDVVNDSQA